MANSMEHYLDNSATTKPSPAAMAALNEAALTWGNPSSVHSHGQRAATVLKDSRAKLAKALGLPRFSKDMLIRLVTRVPEIDYEIKSGEIAEWQALEGYIFEALNERNRKDYN